MVDQEMLEIGAPPNVAPGLLLLITSLTQKYGPYALRIPPASMRAEMGRTSLILQVPLDKLDEASRESALLVTQIRREHEENCAVVTLPAPEDGFETGEPLLLAPVEK
jgi:hypothetical protein